MTYEEKALLIAYLVDAGEIDPEGDVEAQFLECARSMSRWSRARSTTRPFSRPPG